MKSIKPKSDDSNEESVAVVLAESLGCVTIILAGIMVFVALFILAPKAMQEHMAEQAEIFQAERYTIEGTIARVEQHDRPDPFADVKDENGDVEPGFHLRFSHQSDKYTRVHFEDGRHHDFDGVYSKPFPIGEYVIIEYDGIGKVINIGSEE